MGIAEAVAARADCTRRAVGAVLVSPEHRVMATGYNGTPPGSPLSCLAGDCPRSWESPEPGSAYHDCIATHAERNALLFASPGTIARTTLYVTESPCSWCQGLAFRLGVRWIVWGRGLTVLSKREESK